MSRGGDGSESALRTRNARRAAEVPTADSKEAVMIKPSIGRIVHFVASNSVHHAAIITAVRGEAVEGIPGVEQIS